MVGRHSIDHIFHGWNTARLVGNTPAARTPTIVTVAPIRPGAGPDEHAVVALSERDNERIAEAAIVIEVGQIRGLGNEFGHDYVAFADHETPQPHSIIVVSDATPLGQA